MKIALIPLDERPVNTRYPQVLAAIAGAEVIVPSPDVLSHVRQPAETGGLHRWLLAQDGVDVVITSLEMLTSGGLIASRITDDPLAVLLDRLTIIDRLRQASPGLRLYGFNVITRIPDANYAVEEPAYWATHGWDIHRYSQLRHRAAAGQPVDEQLAEVRARIPDALHQDFMQRRLRNHQVNLHAVGMAARGAFDLLVISSDDTSEYGLGSQEKAWVKTWAERLELSDDHLLMYPGADEVGCVLLGRALLNGHTPRFCVRYVIDADRERIAPYEDSPIRVTVERQIRALGGTLVDDADAADFIVAVNTPSAIGQEYDADLENFAAEHARRDPYLYTFVEQVAGWVDAGRRVILCDVAYPNGSDPHLIDLLLDGVAIERLAAYGAWNTAGNTIGTALAQGVVSSMARTPPQQLMQQRFLLHRFIEDWGYQHLVREKTRNWLEETTGIRDTAADNEAQVVQMIHQDLAGLLPRLGNLSAGWRIESVNLPWHRTFEVDFELSHDRNSL